MKNDLPLPFRQAVPWISFITTLFLLNYMARALLSPLLVSIERELGIGHADATSLLLMQSLGLSISFGVCGFTFAWIRPRAMVVFTLVAAGMILFCMPLVSTLERARLFFFAFGLGAGLYFPAGMAVLATLVHTKDWGKAVSIHELAPNGGFIIIPLLAQLLLIFMDWRGVFVSMGILMIAAGLAFMIWGRGGSEHTAAPSFKGCGDFLRNPASWAAGLILVVSTTGEFSIFSILQLFLVSEVHFAPETANFMLSMSRIASPFVVLLGGWAADRFNAALIVRSCFMLQGIGLGLMSLDPTTFRTVVLVGILVQSVSIAFIFPAIFKVYANSFSQDQQPILLSLFMPITGLIASGGVPFFLGYCGQYLTFGVGFFCVGILSIATVLSVSVLSKQEHRCR